MNVKSIEIELRIKPSPDTAKRILTNLLHCLLHSRQQIPFQFTTFQRLVDCKFQNVDKKKDWKIEGQLKAASETIEKINIMRNLISSKYIFGLPLMILFGSTIQTAKESYQISFPYINEISEGSRSSDVSLISSIMLELVQIDGLLNLEETLPLTNVFILFKRKKCDNQNDHHQDLIELRNFKLSKSCKQFKIMFRDPSDFEIFDENYDEKSENNVCENRENIKTDVSDDIWYQSKIYVKGFKDSLVNNKTIWN